MATIGWFWWVVLAANNAMVLWVPLSSVKPWMDHEGTYVFNVGKSNKYINALNDTFPAFRFTELIPVSVLRLKHPKPRGELPDRYVDRICEALLESGEPSRKVQNYLAEAKRKLTETR